MIDIPIYSAEKEIADLIKNNTSISHLVKIEESAPFDITNFPLIEKSLNSANLSERTSYDLFYMKSLLVSSVWNGNDDYFAPIELWLARNTAKDKPFNYEHNENDIIGHMTNSYVINNDGKSIDESTSIDDLPDTIHIISNSVIYRHWSDENRKNQINKIIAEIKNGEWYVSVECLFPKFDYLLESKNGEYKLIARNEKTAFLTKYLRAYKGVGVYDNQKIARVPRNFILSGKGLVKVPANENSVIFASKYNLSKNNLINLENNSEVVYKISEVNNMNEKEFADLKVNYSKLEAEYQQLKASLNDNKAKEIQAQLDLMTKTAEASVQENSVLKAGLEKVAGEKSELQKQIETLTQQKLEAQQALDKIHAEKKYNDRIHLAVSKLGMDEANAKSYVNSLTALTDEAFATLVDFEVNFTKTKAGKVVTEVKALETTEVVKEPTLTVTEKPATKVDEVNKLSAALKNYIEKNKLVKSGEVKFKLDQSK